MEAMVYKNRQQVINFLTINITKWGTKDKVVYNKSHILDIIGSETRFFCGRSTGDPFCGVHQSIGADHP